MSQVPMTRPEQTISIQKHDWGHGPSFVELDDGRIYLSVGWWHGCSEDGGLTWHIEERRDAAGEPVTGSSLVKLSNGAIGLGTHEQVPGAPSRYAKRATFRRSEDGGKTWSDPVVCNPPYISAQSLQDVMLRTSSGRIIFPLYNCFGQGAWRDEDAPVPGGFLATGHFVGTDAHYFDPHFGACFICYSDDDGRSWQINQDGQLFIIQDHQSHYSPVWEPSVTEVSPGRLLMIMRTGLGRLYQAWSQDDGTTWSRPQPTALASDHSPGQIRKLPNGDLLCVWSQHSAEEVRGGYTRTRISSAVSRNEGGVWEFFQNVESMHEETFAAPGPIETVRPQQVHALPGRPAVVFDPKYARPLRAGIGRWSYPSVYVMNDRVLISHTYQRYEGSQLLKDGGNSRLKVLPIEWFYGGEVPTEESVYIKKASQAPQP